MIHLHFTINYYTQPGETLFLNLTETEERGQRFTARYPMQSADDGNCRVTTVLHEQTVSASWFYSLETDGEEVRREWNEGIRTLDCSGWEAQRDILLCDAWYDIPERAWQWSAAFTDCWEPRQLIRTEQIPFMNSVEFRLQAAQIQKGEELALSGDIPELGQWNPALAPALDEFARGEWRIRLPLSLFNLYHRAACKVIIRRSDTKEVCEWEEGENRYLSCNSENCDSVRIDLKSPRFNRPDTVKTAGVVIPVFSLRSENSWGAGDFGDLKRLVDWVALTGMRAIQILPVNDTTLTHTWMDSYPYNCISIYALHPLYLDISALPPLRGHQMKEMEKRRHVLEALPQVDYEAVSALKADYMHALYEREGKKILKSEAFLSFFSQNSTWLVPYAAFCFLRDSTGTADFTQWKSYSRYNAADIRRMSQPGSEYYKAIAYYYYVQYYLSCQLADTALYARRHGVVLKGDIPIGISRESVETWTEPYYFNMDSQTGAPPDPFSDKGQNWGFPTYNWSSMLADGCKWWVNRFRSMSRYFDAYRIDHILGFFRIWEIPLSSVYGLLGHFSPALPLSKEEIEGAGLPFHYELYTTPFVTKDLLASLFGNHRDAVETCFFDSVPNTEGRLSFKQGLNSQRCLEHFFKCRESSFFESLTEKEIHDIQEKLYALQSNVLFIEDRHRPGYFHPRIAAQKDYIYTNLLNTKEKEAFNNLYNAYYYHRHNAFWYHSAALKLPRLVQSTRMLVCGEDLGMIPGCVSPLMKDLRILSLEIESMPKGEGEFADVLNNPYLSVCTIATHDMPTFRQWWEEDPERTSRYYHQILGREGKAPDTATGEICRQVVSRHLASPSMLCLLSLQDWLSTDETLRRPDASAERINVPAESRHYWRYRMHLTIEELLAAGDFNTMLKKMISDAGRNNRE